MSRSVLQCGLHVFFSLLLSLVVLAQPPKKSPGIQLFEKNDIAGAIELLKKSEDFIDQNYLGYAYEKSGDEKEARNAFDRSFKNGYKRFWPEIAKRAAFEPDRAIPDKKLSAFLKESEKELLVVAVSAQRTLDLNGPTTKQNEWLMRARMMREIGRLILSNQSIYSSAEVDTGFKVTGKPRPGYTDEARRMNTQGTVKILVFFDIDGEVKAAVPIASLANGLTEQAYIATTKISFTPAEMNGKPVATLQVISYSFSIY